MPKTLAGMWREEKGDYFAHVGRFIARAYVRSNQGVQTLTTFWGGVASKAVVTWKDAPKEERMQAHLAACEQDFQEYRRAVREEAEAVGLQVTDSEESG